MSTTYLTWAEFGRIADLPVCHLSVVAVSRSVAFDFLTMRRARPSRLGGGSSPCSGDPHRQGGTAINSVSSRKRSAARPMPGRFG